MSCLGKPAVGLLIALAACASYAIGSPITAYGTLSSSKGFTLGLNPAPDAGWSGTFDVADPAATQQMWSQFSESAGKSQLTVINASGVNLVPTDPNNPVRSLEADLWLSIDALANAAYDLDGGYSLVTSIAGSDSFMSASLRCITTGETLFDWKRNMPSSTYFWSFGDVASPEDHVQGSRVGYLKAGNQYELKWHVRVSNPAGGTAVGQSMGPFVFEVTAVPEPAIGGMLAGVGTAFAALRRRK